MLTDVPKVLQSSVVLLRTDHLPRLEHRVQAGGGHAAQEPSKEKDVEVV